MNLGDSGIYAIRNNTNGKAYIGSSINMYRRRSKHFSDLKNNHHYNNYLQNAWNKHGKDNFVFEVLEYVKDEEQLILKEKVWIDKFSNSSYNLIEVVERNFSASVETRKRMSKAQKGRIISKETRQKMSEAQTGRTLSKVTRKKISQELRGNKRGHANIGRIVSEETRAKISKANKGKVRTEETRQKISKALRARTEETKMKISRTLKDRNRMYQNDLQLLLF